MQYQLRLTGTQREKIKRHLFADQAENIAILVCGITQRENELIYTCRTIYPVGDSEIIQRDRVSVRWRTEWLLPVIDKANKEKSVVFKVHSHHINSGFSAVDDEADKELFSSIFCRTESANPPGSLIMYSDGSLIGRVMTESGRFNIISKISVAGNQLEYYFGGNVGVRVSGAHDSQRQAFGLLTNDILSSLKVGVIGCSGIGSQVIEQLSRLGVGTLVLVDPDKVETRNLNRISGTKATDAIEGRFKVDVLAKNIASLNFGISVEPLALEVHEKSVIKTLSGCDVIFGCVDSIDGRDILCRISRFYLIPYFDFGVKLQADGDGGVSQICGTVHILQPESLDLLERGVYDSAQLSAAYTKRLNPERYAELLKENYIKGIFVNSPAVISVNMLTAARGICDFLDRIHSYRDDGNLEIDALVYSLTQERYFSEPYGQSPNLQNLGKGDTAPLLGINLGH